MKATCALFRGEYNTSRRERAQERFTVIFLKACPRCDGDVDATYPEDVYCVQCAHRMPAAPTGSQFDRAASHGPPDSPRPTADVNTLDKVVGQERVPCPRCRSTELVPLDKLRPDYNTCFRCRSCGHVFSPSSEDPSSFTA